MAANTDFTLPRDAYATFDALTLKNLIKNRLREGGVFTDQDFEGSNLSAIIDVIAFSYHLSLFYLNQTSSEALFDEATIFENINRITKLIGYKPTGYKTSALSFDATAAALLPRDIYTIKRYSYFMIDGTPYSFISDASFSKTNIAEENLTELANNSLLYQGKYVEHPVLFAVGEEFENVSLVVKDTINNNQINIEDSSINVYIKSFNTGKFVNYTEIDSIFNAGSADYVFEKRLNENGFYELKFGNGVNGAKLNAGDGIYIYYLKSDGDSGQVSPGSLNGNNLNVFTTTQFEEVSNDIYDKDLVVLTPQRAAFITFTNNNASTIPSEMETVDEIRTNSPRSFFAQNRIVTNDDFISFVTKNYSNIVSSSVLVNNDSFVDTVIKYYYDLGLDRPNQDSRFLFNQTKFATTNQSNHVYAFLVPRIKTVDSANNLFYLSQSQKSEIVNSARGQKIINAEILPQDPVYTAIAIGLEDQSNQKPAVTDIENTFLVVERLLNDRISSTKIQEQVAGVFQTELATDNVSLGHTVNINNITTKILNIEGVTRIKTRKINPVNNQTIREIPFLNLYNFNAAYSDVDINSSGSNIGLPFFKYPFLWNGSVKDNVIVEIVES